MKFRYLIPFLFAAPLMAQTCTTSVCNASSTSQSAVLAALPSSSNANATVTVNIPAGTSNWTGSINYTVPAAVTSLTIQGATSVIPSGTPGTAGFSLSVSDNTVIVDTIPSNTGPLVISPSGGFVRITGITFKGGTLAGGFSKYNGLVETFGTGNFRFDHNHCNLQTYSPAYANASLCWKNGPLASLGATTNLNQLLADYNQVDLTTANDGSQIEAGFSNYLPYNDTIGLGDGPFARATPWGAIVGVMYIENNVFNGGAPNDVGVGSSQVMRNNTINNSYIGVQTHGTKSTGGPSRGGRSIEAYHNYFTCAGCSPASALTGTKGAAALIWGNTVNGQPAYRFYNGGGDRQSGDEGETNTPNGWGYCGTAVNGNGVGSPWDGNIVSSVGYPCLDGLGRGQDVQPLNGQQFNSTPSLGRLNTVTNSIAWSQQRLEPQYLWNNSLGTIAASNYMLLNDSSQNNVDYYYDCTAQTVTGCNGSFTGTSGTGYGLLASRPATCTAGINDSFHASPTGHYGVSYFATNSGANGTLFVCTATNIWTAIYQPAPYPHPLAGGSSPTTNILTVHATNGTVNTTNNCAPGTYNTGTSIGACTATPSGGFTFLTWTATGSAAACDGTSSTCTFTLSSDASLTANFTPTVTQAATPTFSPASGTYISTQSVTLASTTSGATICYTLDGTTPTANGSGTCTHGSTYSTALSVATTTTIKAVASKSGNTDSTVGTALYTIATPGTITVIGTATSGSSNSQTVSRSVTQGDAVYVMPYNGNGAGQTFSISDTLTSSWTFVATSNLTTDNDTIGLYCAIAPSTGTMTVTVAPSGGGPSTRIVLIEVASSTCSPVQLPVTANTLAVSACSSGPMTTTSQPLLLIGVCGNDGSQTSIGTGTGWLNGVTASNAGKAFILGETQITSTTGSFTATSSPFVGTAEQGSIIAAFAPTGGTSNFVLTVTTPVNGTITGSNCTQGTYAVNTTIGPCTATANAGYMFTGWSGGTCVGTSTCTFNLPGNATITANFTFVTAATPTFSPVAGSYGPTQNVTISSATAGATICYTSNGTTPTSSAPGTCAAGSTQYASPVSVASSLTLKAIATKNTNTDSVVGSAAYVINGAVANPTFSPVAGTYGGAQSVTISTATGSATLCYTTDGSTPTATAGTCTHGTTYSGAITVSTSQTVNAIGTKSGFVNSTVTGAAYVINGTLPTPTFSPVAGSYPTAQNVVINAGAAVAAFSGSEGSNSGSPTRNAYNNCATSCIAGVWQPPNSGSVSNGQLACTTAAQSSGVTNGCTARSVVAVTSSGSGLTALSNGFGAGGDDSLTAMTYTYGGASAGDCSGAPATSLLVPTITFPSAANQREITAGTTDATNFNASFLLPTKFASVGTDAAQWGIMRTCVTVPTTTGSGFHYESEPNQTLSTHNRFDYGGHYNFTTSEWYFAGHGASWVAMDLVESDGTSHATVPFPAGHHMYFEDLYYRTAACTSASGSNCMFWVAKCIEDFTAGTPAVCYKLLDSNTGLIPGDVPDSQPTFPQQTWTQTQADFNASAISRQFNIDIKSFTTFSAPTICYTIDGSTPTGDGDGNCTHGSLFALPVLVSSNLTIKAIATQHGFVDSAVGTAAYVIGGTATWTKTIVGTGTVTGINSTSGTYALTTNIGPLTATPGIGYSFTGLSATSGDFTASGTTNPVPFFTLTQNSAATWTFTINSWTVTTSTTGSGTGTITGCSGSHNYGATVTCTANVTSGTFTSWSGGTCSGATNPCVFTMPNNNVTVTATFTATPGAPSVTFSGSGVILSGTQGVQ